jgi:hypothetical protein
MIKLLITGMLRSGTTLLQKALNAHPDIALCYQPFPELFINTKKEYLEKNGISAGYHVLSHYCGEAKYKPSDLTSWLERTLLPQSSIVKFLNPDKQNLIDSSNLGGHTFANWYFFLIHHMQSGKHPRCLGSKEVLVEEFVPYLVHNNVRCIIIVRDPRDVIVSLDYGRGTEFTGDHRPTLFNLRNWRKSIAFAYDMENEVCFRMVRFEDLLLKPVETLNNLALWLGLKPFNEQWWANGLLDETGNEWKGNSSFGNTPPFNPQTAGVHQQILPKTTRLYIEALCGREMLSLGYETMPLSIEKSKECIAGFIDPFVIKRAEFPPNYSSLPENIVYEIERLKKLD